LKDPNHIMTMSFGHTAACGPADVPCSNVSFGISSRLTDCAYRN